MSPLPQIPQSSSDSRGCQERPPAPKPGWPLGLHPPYCRESSCLPEGTALTDDGGGGGGGGAHTQLSQEVAAGAGRSGGSGHAGELLCEVEGPGTLGSFSVHGFSLGTFVALSS